LLTGIEPVADPKLNDRIQIELLSTVQVSHQARQLLTERIDALEDRGAPARSDRERFELVLLAFERLLSNQPAARTLELITQARLGLESAHDQVIRPPQGRSRSWL